MDEPIFEKEYFKKKDQESDYDYSRRIYIDLIGRGAEAVEEAMRVAQETEHPRAYEVLSKLIKDVADTNDKLLDLHKKTKELDKVDREALPPGAEAGSTFVMTTDALQRMLQDQNKEPVEKDITPKPEPIEHDETDRD